MEKSGVPPAPSQRLFGGTGPVPPKLDALYKFDQLLLFLGEENANFFQAVTAKLNELIATEPNRETAAALDEIKVHWVRQRIITANDVAYVFDTEQDDSRVDDLETWLSTLLRDGTLTLHDENDASSTERALAAAAGAGDLPLVQWFVRIKGARPYANYHAASKAAAAHGRLDVYAWLETPEDPDAGLRFASPMVFVLDAVTLAARNGKPNILQWIRERAAPVAADEAGVEEVTQDLVDELAARRAVEAGRVNVLEWLGRVAFTDRGIAVRTAFVSPEARTAENTRTLPHIEFTEIVTAGHVGVMEWAVRNGMTLTEDRIEYAAHIAANSGLLDMFKWAAQQTFHGRDLNARQRLLLRQSLLLDAGERKHVDIVHWLLYGMRPEPIGEVEAVHDIANRTLDSLVSPAVPANKPVIIATSYTIGRATERELAAITERARAAFFALGKRKKTGAHAVIDDVHAALANDNYDEALRLLDHSGGGAAPIEPYEDKLARAKQQLAEAAAAGDAAELARLLRATVLRHMPLRPVDNALIIAAERGHSKAVRVLLDTGKANAHVLDDRPLRLAVANGHADVVHELVRHGHANVHAANDEPLRTAVSLGYTAIVRELLAAGADAGALDGPGLSKFLPAMLS